MQDRKGCGAEDSPSSEVLNRVRRLTLAMIRFRLMPLPQALAEQEWVKRLHRLDGGVPYGIALAAAALLIYPDTAWMHLG